MKEYKLIFIIIISLILPIMINGCISNDNSSNNNDNNKINAEYIVNISTNITEDYTIICPITLSLSEDPAIFSDYLKIIYGNGTFQIIKLSDKHPYYYNLSSTERGEMNIYALQIFSNESVTIGYRIHTDEILPMSLGWYDYWVFFNSSVENMHRININAYSEPSGGNSYYLESQILTIGWQTINIKESGWVP